MPAKHLTLAVLFFAFSAHSSDTAVTYGSQTYKTVKIGTQTWFAENLNYEAEGSKCYDNNPDNCAKYGRLYNWETAMKVCPSGWHLPNNAEWDKLLRFVDGDTGTESPYSSETAGKHLKAANGWDKDGNGTDNYGFSALPGGLGDLGYSRSGYSSIGYGGLWWSSSASKSNSYFAYVRIMNYNEEAAYLLGTDKFTLFSVRCIKD